MGLKANLQVFGFLRFVEGLISLTCGLIHVIRFCDNSEPTQRQILFWGTYFAFVILSAGGIFYIVKERKLKVNLEAATSSAGFIMFITTSIRSMVNAEKDKRLEHLDDIGESKHPYFRNCHLQSVVSLINAVIFLTHASFAYDFILTKPRDDISIASATTEDEIKPERPLRLHFFFEDIWKMLRTKFNQLTECFSIKK